MSMSGGSEDDLRTCSQLALKESDRLNNLLRDFLTFARLDIPLKKEGDLAALIRDRLSGHQLKVAVTDQLPEQAVAEFDADQMGLVVDAVLLSLAEWAEEGNDIRISMSNSSRKKFKFILTGKIVPAVYKDAVFQPFSNIHKKSRGLALPTASRAVHGHGGTIRLESEEGVGTWFELEI
jgi:signal transduction histidine kinase